MLEQGLMVTPDFIRANSPNAAPTTVFDLIGSDPNDVKARYKYGSMEDGRISFDPPVSVFNHELMDDIVDCFMKGDMDGCAQAAYEIIETPLKVHKFERIRCDLSSGESNVEHSFFTSGIRFTTLVADMKLEGLRLLNPSRGTLKRYFEHQNFTPEVWLLPGSDPDYVTEVKNLCRDEFEVVCRTVVAEDLTDQYLYYLSFNATLGETYDLQYYMGFEPNPLQLANLGLIHTVREAPNYSEYTYYRYEHERRMRYRKQPHCGYITYGSDFLRESFKGLHSFKVYQPCMHDLRSTLKLFDNVAKVHRASVLPYGCSYVVGDYSHNKHGVIDQKGNLVLPVGNHVWSSRPDYPCLTKDGNKDELMRRASYCVSPYGSSIIFLGKKRMVKRVDGVFQRWCEGDRKGRIPRGYRTRDLSSLVYDGTYYYEEVDPYDPDATVLVQQSGGNYSCGHAKYKEVPCVELAHDLIQLITSDVYCQTTYQSILGTKVLYVEGEVEF